MEKDKFTPKQWVLVRDEDDEVWRLDIFSHYNNDEFYTYYCIGSISHQCIPYEGNEQLLGKDIDPVASAEHYTQVDDIDGCACAHCNAHKVEDEWKPKDGDIVCEGDSHYAFIYKETDEAQWWANAYVAICDDDEHLLLDANIWAHKDKVRLANDDERNALLFAMKMNGIRWDALHTDGGTDFMMIRCEEYWTISITLDYEFVPMSFQWFGDHTDRIRAEKGWIFDNKEECEAFCNDINKKIINNR